MKANHNQFECRRDYWQLLSTESVLLTPSITVQGRARSTEEYWEGLVLNEQTMKRFEKAIRDAVTIVAHLELEQHPASLAVFPNCECCAICHGSGYDLEITESLAGHGCPSFATTIYSSTEQFKPAVHLIDDELALFCSDVQEALQWVEQHCTERNAVPLVGVL